MNNAEFAESERFRDMARKIINSQERVAHVEIDSVIFLEENITKPRAIARCYSFGDHPICFFTDKPYCIVVYLRNCDYFSEAQFALLLFHEMMHIPTDIKMFNHDVQDFREILEYGLDWAQPNADVINILDGD